MAGINFNYTFLEARATLGKQSRTPLRHPSSTPGNPFSINTSVSSRRPYSTPLRLAEISNIPRKMQISLRSLAKEIEDAYAPPIDISGCTSARVHVYARARVRVSPAGVARATRRPPIYVGIPGLFVFRLYSACL